MEREREREKGWEGKEKNKGKNAVSLTIHREGLLTYVWRDSFNICLYTSQTNFE